MSRNRTSNPIATETYRGYQILIRFDRGYYCWVATRQGPAPTYRDGTMEGAQFADDAITLDRATRDAHDAVDAYTAESLGDAADRTRCPACGEGPNDVGCPTCHDHDGWNQGNVDRAILDDFEGFGDVDPRPNQDQEGPECTCYARAAVGPGARHGETCPLGGRAETDSLLAELNQGAPEPLRSAMLEATRGWVNLDAKYACRHCGGRDVTPFDDGTGYDCAFCRTSHAQLPNPVCADCGMVIPPAEVARYRRDAMLVDLDGLAALPRVCDDCAGTPTHPGREAILIGAVVDAAIALHKEAGWSAGEIASLIATPNRPAGTFGAVPVPMKHSPRDCHFGGCPDCEETNE